VGLSPQIWKALAFGWPDFNCLRSLGFLVHKPIGQLEENSDNDEETFPVRSRPLKTKLGFALCNRCWAGGLWLAWNAFCGQRVEIGARIFDVDEAHQLGLTIVAIALAMPGWPPLQYAAIRKRNRISRSAYVGSKHFQYPSHTRHRSTHADNPLFLAADFSSVRLYP